MITWNEIRNRTISFIERWKNETSEKSWKDSFWIEFLHIFDIDIKQVGRFEYYLKDKVTKKPKWLDLFCPNLALIEHKSASIKLDRAQLEANDYLLHIPKEYYPKYIIVSNFHSFRLINLETSQEFNFKTEELLKYIHLFGFFAGYEASEDVVLDPVNLKVAKLFSKIHELLKIDGYVGEDLEKFSTMLIFCLFAESSGIFKNRIFSNLIRNTTPSDLGNKLALLFQVLSTEEKNRQKNTPHYINEFPFLGSIFNIKLNSIPILTEKIYEILISCCELDWSKISPIIIGEMFQSLMIYNKQKHDGVHYTSENNILKIINSVYLNDLNEKVEKFKNNKNKLNNLYDEIINIGILDPASGCGNFLLVNYKNIRKIEHKILRYLYPPEDKNSIKVLKGFRSKIKLHNFIGFEINESACKIATISMLIIKHLMNLELSKLYGIYFDFLPIDDLPRIFNINSLLVPWSSIVDKKDVTYIMGNPPFVGTSWQSKQQKYEKSIVFKNCKGSKNFDYAVAWIYLAAKFSEDTDITSSFITTGAISRGDQIVDLWNLLSPLGIKINMAHQPFNWVSEIANSTPPPVEIISFSHKDKKEKELFIYDNNIQQKLTVEYISPMLTSNKKMSFVVPKISYKNKLMFNAPRMRLGIMLGDNGHYIISDEKSEEYLKKYPELKPYIKNYINGKVLLQGKSLKCFDLENANPSIIKKLKFLQDIIEKVRTYRHDGGWTEMEKFPASFALKWRPTKDYLAMPRNYSKNYFFVPVAFIKQHNIPSDALLIIETSSLVILGLLSSSMFNSWSIAVDGVSGMMKTLSVKTYNTFVWPDMNKEIEEKINKCVERILKVRESFIIMDPSITLGDLYNYKFMPKKLLEAHLNLDKVIDSAYGKRFNNIDERIKFMVDECQKKLGYKKIYTF